MSEIKEGLEASKVEETPKKAPLKAKEKEKTERVVVKSDTSFEFSDDDIAEFKAWREDKAVRAQIKCEAPEDDKVYRMWKEESRLVKGVFRCRQPDGGNVKFYFRKYKWDRTKEYTMFDGETYEIPLAVARHLNQNCNYAVHSRILGADGNPTTDTTKSKSRMNFESTEFAAA